MAYYFIFITFLLSTVLASVFTQSGCPHGIQTLGTVICPDQVGVFLCEAVNSSSIGWRFNDEQQLLFFGQNDMPGILTPESSNGDAVAYLVRREVASGSSPDRRTSILRYSPLSNTNGDVKIECIANGIACNTIVLQVYSKFNSSI